MLTIPDFDTNHEEAIQKIRAFKNDDLMGRFTNWIMECDIPLHYIIDRLHTRTESAVDFALLLSDIEYAINNNGSISFPLLDNKPLLLLHDECYVDHNFISQHTAHGVIHPKNVEIKFVKTINDFIDEADKYYSNNLLISYQLDIIKAKGRESMITDIKAKYSKSKYYSESWDDMELTPSAIRLKSLIESIDKAEAEYKDKSDSE